MSDGVTITMILDCKPEAVEGLAVGLPEMIKETATKQGFQSIRILRNANKIILVELWDSEADYNAYIAWRTERGDMDGLGQAVNGVELNIWPTLVATA